MATIVLSDTQHQEIPDDLFLPIVERVGDPSLAAAVVKAGLDPAAREQMVTAVRDGRWQPVMLQALRDFMGQLPGQPAATATLPQSPVSPPPMAAPGGGVSPQAPTMRTMTGLPPVRSGGMSPLDQYMGGG